MLGEPYESLTPEELDAEARRGRDLGRVARTRWEGFEEAGFSQTESTNLVGIWLQQHLKERSGDPDL
jgi:hypothetical protein